MNKYKNIDFTNGIKSLNNFLNYYEIDFLLSPILDYVHNSISKLVNDSISDSVRNSVNNSIWNSIWSYLWDYV